MVGNGDDNHGSAHAWQQLVDGLQSAGEAMAKATADMDEVERADAYRALLRGLNNNLSRFEVDRDHPELVPFNGEREKMLMDNPDFAYWVADVSSDRRYRITGNLGDAVYQSLTAYDSAGVQATTASARLDSDDMSFDRDGNFTVTVSTDEPDDDGNWLQVSGGATVLWLRQFYVDRPNEKTGWCSIEPLDKTEPGQIIDAGRFDHRLARLGSNMAALPTLFDLATNDDLERPNSIRHWSEMASGAAFTEPGIHYLRGSWQLLDDEVLVLEGRPPDCRYWNVVLYSRFLNSLDHRSRQVSLTDARARRFDGGYRIVISSQDPGAAADWLDTEGREFGLFVFRFLQPTTTADPPTVRRVKISDLSQAEH